MMEITVMVLEQTTELNGHKNAKGVAEQFGEEIQWEAWKGVGDTTWSVRLPTGLEQGDLDLVDADGVLEAIGGQLPQS